MKKTKIAAFTLPALAILGLAGCEGGAGSPSNAATTGTSKTNTVVQEKIVEKEVIKEVPVLVSDDAEAFEAVRRGQVGESAWWKKNEAAKAKDVE